MNITGIQLNELHPDEIFSIINERTTAEYYWFLLKILQSYKRKKFTEKNKK